MKQNYLFGAALMLMALAAFGTAPAFAQGGSNAASAPVLNDAARQAMDAAKRNADEERRRRQQDEETKKKGAPSQHK